MKWFNLSTPNVDELQREILTLRSIVNSLAAKVEHLEEEIKRRVLMSDVVSLGQDVQEHGVLLEELTEQGKELMTALVNSFEGEKKLTEKPVNTPKPAIRRKKT